MKCNYCKKDKKLWTMFYEDIDKKNLMVWLLNPSGTKTVIVCMECILSLKKVNEGGKREKK